MKDNLQTIGKIIFPALLTFLGLYLVISAIAFGQNGLILAGGIAMTLVGASSILLINGKLATQFQKIMMYAFLGIAVIISFLSFRSIQEPIEFEKEKKIRYARVIERLKDIRTAQIAYKSVKGTYTANFDSLISFLRNDKFTVVKSFGAVPDGMTEKEAIQKGYAKRDTFFVNVRDSVFVKEPAKVDSLPFIPFSGGEKFKAETGSIVKGSVTVQVIEVFAPNTAIFTGLTDRYYNKEGGLKFGSMTEASTNGNWE